eukprot:scaffold32615_cov230-Isochrysis_galbana.AAC.2
MIKQHGCVDRRSCSGQLRAAPSASNGSERGDAKHDAGDEARGGGRCELAGEIEDEQPLHRREDGHGAIVRGHQDGCFRALQAKRERDNHECLSAAHESTENPSGRLRKLVLPTGPDGLGEEEPHQLGEGDRIGAVEPGERPESKTERNGPPPAFAYGSHHKRGCATCNCGGAE